MRGPGLRWTSFGIAILLAVISPRPARAQFPFLLPGDYLARRLDERVLQRDQAQLQRDLSAGRSARVSRDLNRIQHDQWWLSYDERRIQKDSFQPAAPLMPRPAPVLLGAMSLVPHPQYPGYGYLPSNPAQLYPLPQPTSASDPKLLNVVPTNAPPPASGPQSRVPVEIVGGGPPRAVVNFLIDGNSYRVESGQRQRLELATASRIVYHRGAEFGVQEYALAAGVYEFRPGAQGWALVRLPESPQNSANPRSILVPIDGSAARDAAALPR